MKKENIFEGLVKHRINCDECSLDKDDDEDYPYNLTFEDNKSYPICPKAIIVSEAEQRMNKLLEAQQKEFDGKIEQLKKEVTDLYHQLGTHKVWGVGGDTVCDNCEELVLKKIDKVFGSKNQSAEEKLL